MSPVDPAALYRLAAPQELLDQLRVDLESLGDREELVVQLAQTFGRHRRDDCCAARARDSTVALRGLPDRLTKAIVCVADPRLDRRRDRGDLVLGHDALGDEML